MLPLKQHPEFRGSQEIMPKGHKTEVIEKLGSSYARRPGDQILFAPTPWFSFYQRKFSTSMMTAQRWSDWAKSSHLPSGATAKPGAHWKGSLCGVAILVT
jgi:hypothetical protein